MPRPTIAAIRRVLDDLGLPQVDPSSWFDGTMPEILRASLDFGRVSPLLESSIANDGTFTSPANIGEDIIIVAPGVTEVHRVRRFFIRFITANITQIRIFVLSGVKNTNLWDDDSGPFPAGVYLGHDGPVTESLAPIMRDLAIMGDNADFDGQKQQLHIEFISAAAAIKTIEVDSLVDNYQYRDWIGP